MSTSEVPPAFNAHLTPLVLRLRDINAFQLPRLTSSSSASTSTTSDSKAVNSFTPQLFTSYENEINEAFQECVSLIEEGNWLVKELLEAGNFDAKVEGMMTTEWQRAKASYQSARASSRSALLSARKKLAERKKAGLLNKQLQEEQRNASDTNNQTSRSSQHSKPQVSTKASSNGDDAALLASSELTNSLQNALGILSDSLSQSTLSATLLEESTSTLSTLSLSYTSFTDLLKNSSGILKSMESQDRWDALMLLCAYLFFVVCILYILKVRIWDRGFKVLMILLRLGGIRSGKDVKEKLELAKQAKEVAAASSSGQAVQEAITNTISQVAAAVTATTTAAAISAGASGSSPVVQSQPNEALDDDKGILETVEEIVNKQTSQQEEAVEEAGETPTAQIDVDDDGIDVGDEDGEERDDDEDDDGQRVVEEPDDDEQEREHEHDEL
ncbi:unnamed protein product [Sympodiomycopsis kandeliae]